MARDLVVAQPQQWKLFSWSGPRRQGFPFARKNSRREIGMLMFQRRTIIDRKIILSRMSFDKPTITRLVAKNTLRVPQWLGRSQTAQIFPSPPFFKRIPIA